MPSPAFAIAGKKAVPGVTTTSRSDRSPPIAMGSIETNGDPRDTILGGWRLENKSCEQYRVSENGERPDCGDRVAGRMAGVNQPNSNSRDDRADDPNQNLCNGQPVSSVGFGHETRLDQRRERYKNAGGFRPPLARGVSGVGGIASARGNERYRTINRVSCG
jgi:hypothetical protein